MFAVPRVQVPWVFSISDLCARFFLNQPIFAHTLTFLQFGCCSAASPLHGGGAVAPGLRRTRRDRQSRLTTPMCGVTARRATAASMGPLLPASLFSLASASLGSPSSPHPPSQLTACPNDCSFHGVCIRSTCECDLGWTSADCSLSVLSAISEGVRELIPQAKALSPAPPRTPRKPLTATVPLPCLTPIPCLTPMPRSHFALLFLTIIYFSLLFLTTIPTRLRSMT